MKDFKELSPVSCVALVEGLCAVKGSEHRVTYLFDFAVDLGRPTPKVNLGEISDSQHHVAASCNSTKIVGERRGTVSANVPRSLVTTESELIQPTSHMLAAVDGRTHTQTSGSGGVSPSISFFGVLCPMVFGTFAKTKILQTQLCAAATEQSAWFFHGGVICL